MIVAKVARDVVLQQHLQTFVDSARQAALSASCARRSIIHVAFDLYHSVGIAVSLLLYPRALTFCFRHATQAVILREMSGGFRSPKESRRAMAASGEDLVTSMAISDHRSLLWFARSHDLVCDCGFTSDHEVEYNTTLGPS